MYNIAIFASGQGTNAEALIRYFSNHAEICVSLVVSSRSEAPVIGRANRLGVPCVVLTKSDMMDEEGVLRVLSAHDVTHIVLAGYLLRIPGYLVHRYARCIYNIHPALLPLHGGKGMYGDRVHQDVIDCGERESGITIHYVDEAYDSGSIIYQARCPVLRDDTPASLAQRIHALEYVHYPRVVAECILG